MKIRLHFAVLGAVSIALAGCSVYSPQTRGEFINYMKAHNDVAMVKTYVSHRPFIAVSRAVERKWAECYAVGTSETHIDGATRSHIVETYHPHVSRVGNSRVELTLQQTTQGMIMLTKVPPGGLYMVAMDVDRMPGGKTKLVWYSGAGGGAMWEQNKKWSEGVDAPCRSD